MRAAIVVLLILGGTAGGETFRVWPMKGDIEHGHKRECGQKTRDDLRGIVSKVPIIIIHEMPAAENTASIVTQNWGGEFYAKRCDRVLNDVPVKGKPGVLRHLSWWDEKDKGATFMVSIITKPRTRERNVELVIIRRSKAPGFAETEGETCYEKWVGIAEVQ